mmetsp:Transcript_26927/g.77260  ORF Transcript_26927/g.77260 Transcript_26927/m.77260 type:complete len:460 (+) Transcript_26927:6-1385(+)
MVFMFCPMTTPLHSSDDLLDSTCRQGDDSGPVAASKTRWWILLTFALFSQLQAATWNFYGPISEQIEAIQGWSLPEIAWLANTANLTMIVSVPLSASFVDRNGLRCPTIVCGALVSACAVLRCVRCHSTLTTDYVVAVLSMLCNGAAAGWLTFGGPVVSAAWFKATERGLATAVVSVSPFIGQSIGFVLGPFVVPQGPAALPGYRRLCLGEAVAACLLLVAVVLHFPERPPVPPSHTAGGAGTAVNRRRHATPREWLRLGVVIAASAIPNGVFGGWVPVLTPNLSGFGVSESEAAWIGCLTTLVGAAGGLIFGRLADRHPGRLKEMMLLCLCCSAVGFAWFALAANGVMPGGALVLCISGMLGGFFVNALFPLGFEFAVETGYPAIPEPQAAGALLFTNTAVQIAFLGMSSGTPASSGWMNWLNVASSALMVPLLAFFPARYPRLAVDGIAVPSAAAHQ